MQINYNKLDSHFVVIKSLLPEPDNELVVLLNAAEYQGRLISIAFDSIGDETRVYSYNLLEENILQDLGHSAEVFDKSEYANIMKALFVYKAYPKNQAALVYLIHTLHHKNSSLSQFEVRLEHKRTLQRYADVLTAKDNVSRNLALLYAQMLANNAEDPNNED